MKNVSSHSTIKKLSNNQCEVMVRVNDVWTRCGLSPAEVHHRIKRSQGGRILDEAGEIYHLMDLCRAHHKYAHESTDAYTVGLLLEGSVISGVDGPQYTGPDDYLSTKYGD